MPLVDEMKSSQHECDWSSPYSSLEAIDTDDLVKDYNVVQIVASRRILRIRIGGLTFYLIGSGSYVHIVIPRIFCSCTDFSINVALRCSKRYCIHMAAVELAERKGLYREAQLDPGEASELIAAVLEAETTYRPIV
ncbi:metal-binding protein [Desulfurococcaceae archaeon AG1]|jgi:predicted nucleic acid-binding Zn finger protein|nr:MAG: hypothetical protein DJ555_01285 [Desulfurococcaceae archaeon]GAY25341.1 metal-binding protein [Desulfurococcaceae archaeon AG1]